MGARVNTSGLRKPPSPLLLQATILLTAILTGLPLLLLRKSKPPRSASRIWKCRRRKLTTNSKPRRLKSHAAPSFMVAIHAMGASALRLLACASMPPTFQTMTCALAAATTTRGQKLYSSPPSWSATKHSKSVGIVSASVGPSKVVQVVHVDKACLVVTMDVVVEAEETTPVAALVVGHAVVAVVVVTGITPTWTTLSRRPSDAVFLMSRWSQRKIQPKKQHQNQSFLWKQLPNHLPRVYQPRSCSSQKSPKAPQLSTPSKAPQKSPLCCLLRQQEHQNQSSQSLLQSQPNKKSPSLLTQPATVMLLPSSDSHLTSVLELSAI